MQDRDKSGDADPARRRIAEILRSAIGNPEEEALEDETRRLMLHLSIEPTDEIGARSAPAAPLQTPAASVPSPPPGGLLRRILRRPRRSAET